MNEKAFPDPMRGAPQSEANQTPWDLSQGLTKREIFAMAAMQGILSSFPNGMDTKTTIEDISESAVEMADALLAALEK